MHLVSFSTEWIAKSSLAKELYSGTPNTDIRKLCTVHCGRNVNKPSAPTEAEFFVLISSHCSTQIWRIRYGGSWAIYFLSLAKELVYLLLYCRSLKWIYMIAALN